MSSYFTNAFAFINANSIKTNVCGVWRNGLAMRMSSSESSTSITGGISRLDTLQTMISITGCPGSKGCSVPGDLVPIKFDSSNTELLDLHPHLFPIAKSTSSSNFICALRRAYADDAGYESSSSQPWPIVESSCNGFGYKLLALNSECLMRRIAAQVDDDIGDVDQMKASDVISMYNQDLGKNNLATTVFKELDQPYDLGSVQKLGYGLEKYILLRVGPFPDLYRSIARQHAVRNDETSSLVAAESANGKFTGFGSSFADYASLLSTLPNRDEEARDAARMCLRMPISSLGLTEGDLTKVAIMTQLATTNDQQRDAIKNMKEMYEKIRSSEQDDEKTRASMTPKQLAIEEGNYLLDMMAFVGDADRKWSQVRGKLGDLYSAAGLKEMGTFVNPINN